MIRLHHAEAMSRDAAARSIPLCPTLQLLAVTGLLVLSVIARGAEREGPWSGDWRTYWRDSGALMTLVHRDDVVTGTYEPGGGVVRGHVEGRVLRGTWREGEVSGGLVFALSPDGRTFTGRYDTGEYWNGTRSAATVNRPVRFTATGSPRDTLRSLLVAANDAIQGGDVAALRFVDTLLLFEGESSNGRERNRRRTLLWKLLDMSTLRVYDAPPRPQTDTATFMIGPVGTTERYPLRFRRDTAGTWRVVVESEAALASSVGRFLAALGYDSIEALRIARRSSPRATMRDFIIGTHTWRDGGKERALATLDLSFLPEHLRTTEGPMLADYLKQIIDRAGYVIWQEIPDDPEQPAPYVHYEHALGAISIERVESGAEDGDRWRFSARTLREAPYLYSAMQELPPVEGLRPQPPLTRLFAIREEIRQRIPSLVRRNLVLENWQWLALIAVIGLTAVVARALAAAAHAGLERLLAGVPDGDTAGRAKAFRWPIRLVVAGMLLSLAFDRLGVVGQAFEMAYRVVTVLAVVGTSWLAFLAAHEIGGHFMRRAERTPGYADEIVTSLATGVVKLAVVVAGLVAVADIAEIPYEGVLTGLGVGGVALAFAARETVSNMLSGALLMTDRPFRRGDLLETDGQLAVVQTVGLRSTRLKRLDDSMMIIPNSQLSDRPIVNLGMRRRRRIDLPIQLTYDTPRELLDVFVEELRRVFLGQPDAVEEDCFVALRHFDDSAIEIECRGFFLVHTYEAMVEARHKLVGDVIDLAERLGVSFAFPTRTVHVLNGSPQD